jgi:uncharacterized repeat protein (TIGR03803 family)
MMLSTCRTTFCCSGLGSSHSHLIEQTKTPEGSITPRSKIRVMHWTVLFLVVVVSMLWPASIWAQYTESVLYSFCQQGGLCPDGGGPQQATPIFDSQGNLYGTVVSGGANNGGAVYELTPPPSGSGPWTEALLYSFCQSSGCPDGKVPHAGMIFDSNGNLYGTTSDGGNSSRSGVAFELSPPAGGHGPWTETVLHTFCMDGPCSDGKQPEAGLIFDSHGNLYGTTLEGGAHGAGAVFELSPAGGGTWTESVLYSFCGASGCADGASPVAGLIFDSAGNLYGTTQGGGAHGAGAVFELSPAGGGTWTENILWSFCSVSGCTDGYTPLAGLIFDSQGNLYGTAQGGGANGNGGVAFELSPAGGGRWTESVLQNFCLASCSEGSSPQAALIFDSRGNLFGTTYAGGSTDHGVVFELSPSGGGLWTETVIHAFTGMPDGAFPASSLIFDSHGNLYGTAGQGAYGVGAVFELSSQAVQFVPVTPCRLVDTRPHPIQGMMTETFNLPQLAQLGKNCPAFDLSTAAAYSLNVTVVPQGFLGYLTIWPAGQSQPVVSTLNSYDGRVKANAAIVPAGASQAVSVFVTNTTDVLLDIDGYFTTPSQQTLQFYPLTPCRVADTRDAKDFASGLGPPYLMAQVERDFPVLNAANNKVPCNIPSSAAAYSLNFTAVPHGFLGYLTVWPTGKNQPVVSTLNAYGGQVTANAAIVPAGTSGSISTYALDDTDLLIDINGYFAPPGPGGLSLYPVVPCRVLDTRPHPFQFELSPPVDVVNSPCGVPSTAQAYVFNTTVVPQGGLGYLTLWPDGSGQPVVSTLNAYDGAVSSNMAIVPAGSQGKVDAYADPLNPSNPNDVTDLLLDISSYFAP